MKTLISITALRREMADLRRKIMLEKELAEAYIKEGFKDMAAWHLMCMEIMENGLKWRATVIRREQNNRKGGNHGKTRF